MKTLKSLAILSCVGLFLFASNIKADEWNKETKITFSGPVQVQDTQLPAGTYVFKLANSNDRHIVQIFNEDQSQVIATIMAIPDYRVTPTDNTVVKFAETSDGTDVEGTVPDAGIPIKEWFYPGDNLGAEFQVVPRSQVAVVQPEAAAAPAASPEPQVESAQAAVPPAPQAATSPEPQAAAPTGVTASSTEDPEAQEAAPAVPPQTENTAPSAEQTAAPAELPQTASQMPLLGLIGILSLAVAASLRIFLKISA